MIRTNWVHQMFKRAGIFTCCSEHVEGNNKLRNLGLTFKVSPWFLFRGADRIRSGLSTLVREPTSSHGLAFLEMIQQARGAKDSNTRLEGSRSSKTGAGLLLVSSHQLPSLLFQQCADSGSMSLHATKSSVRKKIARTILLPSRRRLFFNA